MNKGVEFIKACLDEMIYPVFSHLKTGNKYRVLDIVVNTTNANDGDIMILYHRSEELVPGKLFCRESKEFFEKFKSISEPVNYKLAPDYDPNDDGSDEANQKDYAESLKD